MPLAPLDLFGCVITADAFYFGGLDALAIQTTRRRVLVAAGLLPHTSAHGVMQTLPVAAQAPPAKVMIDALPLWIFARQHAPLDAADHHVEDSVDDQTHVQRTRASARFRFGNQVFDMLPLAVSQIGRIDLVRHTQNLPDCTGWQSTSQTASKSRCNYRPHRLPSSSRCDCPPHRTDRSQ